MKRLLLFALLVTACSRPSHGGMIPDSAALASAAATITPTDVRTHVAFLASDELQGRDTPSPGLETAAEWIVERFQAAGLAPAADSGWIQRYPYPAEQLETAETRFGVVSGATHFFRYGTEYFARRGAALPGGVGAVYTGAIEAGDSTLLGRAVIVRLDAAPMETERGLRLPRGVEREVGRVRDRAREAGAAAVVYLMPGLAPADVRALADREERVERGLAGSEARPLPLFFLARPAAIRIFRTAGLDTTLVDRDVSAPVPLPGVTLRLSAPSLTVDDARPPNVVGMIPGADPALRDSYVLLTAHMDHVGVGTPDETGDSIYNGADDNASGTSVLVEVAEAMARLTPGPRRSIVFLAVSGEEKGLLGSYWFSEHPTIPLDRVVASINVDMVGRNAPDSIVVIGQEYSTLGRIVNQVARDYPEIGLTVSEDLWPEQRFFFRSDHFNMARKEIPSLFFFAGIHEDYHRPGDELDEVDADKVARVGRLLFYLTHTVASVAEPPQWHRDGLETIRRLTR
jgi:hypothetical protein